MTVEDCISLTFGTICENEDCISVGPGQDCEELMERAGVHYKDWIRPNYCTFHIIKIIIIAKVAFQFRCVQLKVTTESHPFEHS